MLCVSKNWTSQSGEDLKQRKGHCKSLLMQPRLWDQRECQLGHCQRDFINVLFENFKQQPRCTIVKENANCFDVGAAASKLVLILTANYQMIKKNWHRLFLYFLKTEVMAPIVEEANKERSSQIAKSTSCNKSPD